MPEDERRGCQAKNVRICYYTSNNDVGGSM